MRSELTSDCPKVATVDSNVPPAMLQDLLAATGMCSLLGNSIEMLELVTRYNAIRPESNIPPEVAVLPSESGDPDSMIANMHPRSNSVPFVDASSIRIPQFFFERRRSWRMPGTVGIAPVVIAEPVEIKPNGDLCFG